VHKFVSGRVLRYKIIDYREKFLEIKKKAIDKRASIHHTDSLSPPGSLSSEFSHSDISAAVLHSLLSPSLPLPPSLSAEPCSSPALPEPRRGWAAETPPLQLHESPPLTTKKKKNVRIVFVCL